MISELQASACKLSLVVLFVIAVEVVLVPVCALVAQATLTAVLAVSADKN